ncbi:helix-turn-helix transcriptional regulator [Demequina sp. NBRC 110054]|uniref:ArsR/SmtB family transcription factor n=1 Tax=Demequina sp. NBRC 110054 TaxID=1570343 RepID=UPI001F30F734|nr:metalloregulator ArsR/SmtB family transcription factor [Demequina sp. NBRC 110054]
MSRDDAAPLATESAALLAAIADPLRHSVLRFLDREGEQCVCDIQAAIPIAGNLLSYHLKTLRDAGLVSTQRRGRWVHYRVADDAASRLSAALPLTLGSPS